MMMKYSHSMAMLWSEVDKMLKLYPYARVEPLRQIGRFHSGARNQVAVFAGIESDQPFGMLDLIASKLHQCDHVEPVAFSITA
jgi:hypothetical protein